MSDRFAWGCSERLNINQPLLDPEKNHCPLWSSSSIMLDRIVWFINNAWRYQETLVSWPFTLSMTGLYLVSVLVAKLWMAKRERYDLKAALGYHNLFLCIWSLAMVIGGVIEIYNAFATHSFTDVYCSTNERPTDIMQGPAWFWIWFFYFSKFYEFVDTAFIILRKTPLITLHVWHHAVVAPLGVMYLKQNMFFLMNGVWANGLIHVFMYWSYFMTARGAPPAWKKYLTLAQLIQFVYGVSTIIPMPYVCGFSYWDLNNGNTQVFWAQEFVLVSFFVLFLQFYHSRYEDKKPSKDSASNGSTSNGHAKTKKVD